MICAARDAGAQQQRQPAPWSQAGRQDQQQQRAAASTGAEGGSGAPPPRSTVAALRLLGKRHAAVGRLARDLLAHPRALAASAAAAFAGEQPADAMGPLAARAAACCCAPRAAFVPALLCGAEALRAHSAVHAAGAASSSAGGAAASGTMRTASELLFDDAVATAASFFPLLISVSAAEAWQLLPPVSALNLRPADRRQPQQSAGIDRSQDNGIPVSVLCAPSRRRPCVAPSVTTL